MRVTIHGLLLRASSNERGSVSVVLIQGDRTVNAYAKAGQAAKSVLEAADRGPLAPVTIEATVFSGTDYETQKPNGRLSVRIEHCELSEVEASAFASNGHA